MSPALNPGGSCQVSLVAWPESPGLRQYVCQPSRMSNSRATQNDWPGAIVLISLISRAFTLSVATVFPVSAKAAGDASNSPNNKYLNVCIIVCYRIKRGKTLEAGGLWITSHIRSHTASWTHQLMEASLTDINP